MIKVVLHGSLRACGGPYHVHATSPLRATRLIAAQVPAFEQALRSGKFRVRMGPLGAGGRTLRPDDIRIGFGRHEQMHITPVGRAADGKNRTIGKVVLGVALLGVGLVGGFAAAPAGVGLGEALGGTALTVFGQQISWGGIALFGAAQALQGFASVLTGNPAIGRYENREAPEDRPNFLFSGGVNTVGEGPAIAWVYGKDVFVGTNVISAGIIAEQIGPPKPEPAVDGVLAQFDGAAAGTVLAKPKKAKFKAPEESPDSVQSKSVARLLEAVGEGELELYDGLRSVYLDGTPVQNDDESYNFEGYSLTWRAGTAQQSSIPGLPEIEIFEDTGSPTVEYATPVIRQVTEANANAARVTLRWPGGLRRVDSSGDLRGTTVQFAIDYRSSGGDWVEAHNVTFAEKAAAGYEISYRVDLPAGGNPWDLRVRRLSPDAANASTTDAFQFASITTLIEARLSYPYTALAFHEIDAKAFGQGDIPKRVLRVRRVDALIPSNYDPDTREYNGFWDGSFKKGCSDCPPWGLRDLMLSRRFGCGDDVIEDLVDDAALYAIAQYCDGLVPDGKGGMEPRYTFNGSLSSREDAYQVFNALAAAFMGMIYWGPGAIVATQDRPKSVTKIVSPANVLGGSFAYKGVPLRSRHSVVKGTWNDPERQGQPAIAYEYDPDSIIDQRRSELDLYLWGCTSEGLAHRRCRWALETEQHGSETVNYGAALDHADVMPGDIVGVQDPAVAGVSLSGRLAGLDTGADTVTLDRAVTLAAGETYAITLTGRDGLPLERGILDGAGSHTTLHLDAALPSPAPLKGSLWSITGSDVAPRQFQVITNSQTGKIEFGISALLHDPDKFARVEQEVQLPPRPSSLLPSSKPKTPVNLTVSEYFYQAGPQVKSAALFGWEQPTDTSAAGFEAQYRPAEDARWVALNEGGDSRRAAVTRTLLDLAPGAYVFRVRAYSAIGVRGDWAELSVSLLAQQQYLADVTEFRAAINGGQLALAWKPLADLRMPPYEIRYTPLLSGAEWSQMGLLVEQASGSQINLAALPGTYAIKAKTVYAESQNAVYVVIENVPNNFNVVDTLTEHPSWSGTLTDLTLDGSDLVLAAGDALGTYQVAAPYDLGGVFGARITAQWLATATDTTDIMASWATLAAVATLSGVSAADWSIRLQIRTTPDDPGGSPVWSAWGDLVQGLYTARAFDFRLVVEAFGAQIEVRVQEFTITIDMEDRIVTAEDVVSDAGGTTIPFDPPFLDTPRIFVTGQDMATGDYWRVTAKSPSSATVRFFNSVNTGISRTFDLAAIGKGVGS